MVSAPQMEPHDTRGPIRRDLRKAQNPAEVVAHANRLRGLTIEEILRGLDEPALAQRFHEGRGKSGAGLVIEACFGIPPNPTPEPDFPDCGVELKTLPLVHVGSHLRVKERTSVSMIDYARLATEQWETASVRSKLSAILFVFVQVDGETPGRSRVLESRLWHPDETDEAIFQLDWTATRDRVAKGFAHLLSESDAWALAASRKGAGNSRDQVRQPNSEVPALRRAFTLKPCFTSWVFSDLLGRSRSESVIEAILPEVRARGFNAVEQRIIAPLRRLAGTSLGTLADRYGVAMGTGKNLAATIIKRGLGFRSVNSRVREFDQLGIEVRVLTLRAADREPYEAISFPAVNLVELAGQEWEDSELASQVHRILFVPTYSVERHTPQAARTLGRSFFWSPSLQEVGIIEREWRMFRDEVTAGRAEYSPVPGSSRRRNALTPASRTQIIHMRPHGRNAADVYKDPAGKWVTKQCFWLNKAFVARLVRQNDPVSVGAGHSGQAAAS